MRPEIPLGTETVLGDELAVRALREYMPRIWPTLGAGTKLIRGWYLDAIADHCDAVGRFLCGKPGGIHRLLISIVFRSLKSTTVNVGLPSWLWLHDPTIRILSASYDQTLSTRDTWATRQVMRSDVYARLVRHQWVQHGIKTWQLAGDQNVKSFYANTRGGWRLGTQVGGGTGQGGRLILVDDPLSIDGAQSEAVTESANEWLWRTLWTRQDEPAKTGMILAAHRTREDDPTGQALAKDLGFEYLELPLEYDPAIKRRATSIGFTDPRKVEGESLEPRRWTPEVIVDLKKALDTSYAALAQQRPERSRRKPITPEMLHRWREIPAGGFDRLVQTWDTSFRGEDPTDRKKTSVRSQTAGHLYGLKGTRAYLLDRDTRHMDASEQIEAIDAMFARWKRTAYALVEAEANGDAIISLMGKRRPLVPIDPRTQGSKYLRLVAVLPFLRAGQLLLPPDDHAPWVKELVAALLRFPGKPDDDVDAFTQLARFEWLPDYVAPEQSSLTGAAAIRALSE